MDFYVQNDHDWKPKTFDANEYFVVFKDSDVGVVGCGNIVWSYMDESLTELEILNIEAYEFNGAKIINYLINENQIVIISGKSLEDSKEFWKKMGASFIDSESFIITKAEFKETKYYKDLDIAWEVTDEKYVIKREGATFLGNLDKGDVVKIISRKRHIAEIDSGYIQDMIMIEDLEHYGQTTKPEKYKVYTVTGEFRHENFNTCKFNMNIIATDEQMAIEVCREHASMADGFDGGAQEYLENEEISECITILDVKEYSTEVFQGEVFGTITLLTGNYFENFIEPWKDVIKRVTDESNNDYPRVRVMSVHIPNTAEDHVFFYKSNNDNEESLKAILSCERKGIDPFGH